MCTIDDCTATHAPTTHAPQGPSRRGLLRGMGIGALAVAGTSLAAGCSANPSGAAATAAVPTGPVVIGDPKARTRVVTLGTGGGPVWSPGGQRAGISTAVVYGDRYYVVDLGWGSAFRLGQSGLGSLAGPGSLALKACAGILFTHLHSDHIADWSSLYLTGVVNAGGKVPERGPIKVFGPGDRAQPPRVYPPSRPAPPLVSPAAPGAGTKAMTAGMRAAFAADLNDRQRDQAQIDVGSLFDVHDIDLSGVSGVESDLGAEGVPPRMTTPLQVWTDGEVQITATLVDHRPTAPSFAFRFDTPDGSVVVSGDTTVTLNLIDLARDCDVLVNECIDPAFVEKVVALRPPEMADTLRQHLYASHTTIEQVGRDIAEPAGARTLLLTHLGDGTSDDDWKRAQTGYSGNVVVGSDLLQMAVTR